jgi:hypothetical protein
MFFANLIFKNVTACQLGPKYFILSGLDSLRFCVDTRQTLAFYQFVLFRYIKRIFMYKDIVLTTYNNDAQVSIYL